MLAQRAVHGLDLPHLSMLIVVALALGYAVGLVAALFLLPGPMVQPVLGRLAVASGILGIGAGLFLWLRWRDRRGQDDRQKISFEAGEDEEADGAGEIGADEAVLETLTRRWADPLARRPDGALSPKELRQILFDGRVELRGTAVLSLPDRDQAFLLVMPTLRDHAGAEVAPGDYLRTAAACALTPLLDRVVVVRALHAVKGGATSGAVACTIGGDSLLDPAFLDGVEECVRTEPALVRRLVVEVDALPRRPGAGPAMRRLARLGVRFCLKRISPAPPDLKRMRELGFDFVRLCAPRVAVVPEVAGAAPALASMMDAVRAAGMTVVAASGDAAPLSASGAATPAGSEVDPPAQRVDAA